MPDEHQYGIPPRRGGASNLPSHGTPIGGPYPLSHRVTEIQGAKPYPANYVPSWIERRAQNARSVAEATLRTGEIVEGPPVEREVVIHQAAEKIIRIVAAVLAVLLTVMGKARHLIS